MNMTIVFYDFRSNTDNFRISLEGIVSYFLSPLRRGKIVSYIECLVEC